MGTHAIERGGRFHAHLPAAARMQLSWLAGGLALGFLVPFVFADLLELPRDLYYGVYVAAVAGFVALWAARTGQPLGALARRRRPLAVALGLVAAGILALVVLRSEDVSARPDGLELVGAVVWRGLVYGVADGLLLSVFPILAVFALFAGTRARERWTGTIAVGLAALVASLAMTAVYHLGYGEFRSSEVRKPVAGDVVWSAPTLLTLNPVGAPIAHAGLHVAAVLESYETDLFLPPHD
jgi:hypothetical protein